MARGRSTPRGLVGAFTLLESLVAVTLLGTIMLAVVAALSASQSVAFEGQKRILVAIACDDLMSEICTLSYDDAKLRDGTVEGIGQMETLDGVEYPGAFWCLGRSTSVEQTTMSDPESGASVEGILITVAGFDESATLLEISLFMADPNPILPEPEPEPESQPDPEEGGGLEGGGIEGGGKTGGGLLGGGGGGTLGGLLP